MNTDEPTDGLMERREFLRKGFGGVTGIAVTGTAILAGTRSTAKGTVWQIDPQTCIRCGACLNICPVYRAVGGHAYGDVYSGPMGSVLAPPLLGFDGREQLPYACTLCGACLEVCPPRIDLPGMLVKLRNRVADDGGAFGWLT